MIYQTSWFALITSYDNNVIQAETNLICLWVHGQGKLNDHFGTNIQLQLYLYPFILEYFSFVSFMFNIVNPCITLKICFPKLIFKIRAAIGRIVERAHRDWLFFHIESLYLIFSWQKTIILSGKLISFRKTA